MGEPSADKIEEKECTQPAVLVIKDSEGTEESEVAQMQRQFKSEERKET